MRLLTHAVVQGDISQDLIATSRRCAEVFVPSAAQSRWEAFLKLSGYVRCETSQRFVRAHDGTRDYLPLCLFSVDIESKSPLEALVESRPSTADLVWITVSDVHVGFPK